jgi:hypothetical protein
VVERRHLGGGGDCLVLVLDLNASSLVAGHNPLLFRSWPDAGIALPLIANVKRPGRRCSR